MNNAIKIGSKVETAHGTGTLVDMFGATWVVKLDNGQCKACHFTEVRAA